MRRTHWDLNTGRSVERTKVDAFIDEVVEVCQRYKFSIGSNFGAFVIEPFHEANARLLEVAAVDLGARVRAPAPPQQPEERAPGDPELSDSEGRE